VLLLCARSVACLRSARPPSFSALGVFLAFIIINANYIQTARRRPDPAARSLVSLFAGPQEEGLDAIEWDEFFRTFDENNLAFLYQERTATGRKSRFAKFVDRDSVEVSSQDEEGSRDEGSESTESEQGRAGTARDRQHQRH
jgi:hypothetical protein